MCIKNIKPERKTNYMSENIVFLHARSTSASP